MRLSRFRFSADRAGRRSTALLVVLALAGSCRDGGPTGPTFGPPAAVLIVSGDVQTAVVGTQLPAPLVVQVKDADGHPLPQTVVNFVVTSGNGSVFAPAVQTNDAGTAQNLWTLGTIAGVPQAVEVRAVDATTGEARTYATFHATAIAGTATSVVPVAGDAQTGGITLLLPAPLQVRVNDQYGSPVPGITVTWATPVGGGSVNPTSSTTGADGVATTRWTLGTHLEAPQRATATAGALAPATFTATGIADGVTLVGSVSRGDGQVGAAGETLADSVVIAVRTTDGRPVIGLPLSTAPSGGGTITLLSGATDAGGELRGRWTLAQLAGANTLAVSYRADQPPLVTLTATGTAGPAVKVTLGPLYNGSYTGCGSMSCENRWVAGTSASAFIASAARNVYSLSGGTGPYALVQDRFGNPVPGATVGWTAVGSAIYPAASVTDASGKVKARWVPDLSSTSRLVYAAISPDIKTSIVISPADGAPELTIRIATTSTMELTAGRDTTLALQLVAANQPTNAVSAETDYLTLSSTNAAVASAVVVGEYPGTVRIIANAPGTATITGTIGGMSFSTGVTVNAEPPATVVIQGKGNAGQIGSLQSNWIGSTALMGISSVIGAQLQYIDSISARVLDRLGNPAVGTTVTWTPANGLIVRPLTSVVGADGMARTHLIAGPNGGGVLATAGTAKDSSYVNINGAQNNVSLVIVPSSSTSMTAGSTQNLLVQFHTVNGNVDFDSDFLSWTSSNPAVASVSMGAPARPAVGLLTAHAAGTTTLTATNGTFSASVTVTVSP